MPKICSIKRDKTLILDFFNRWKDALKNDLNGTAEQFRSAIQQEFSGNQIAIKQLQQQLDNAEIELNLGSLSNEIIQSQTHDLFKHIELKSTKDELKLFGSNLNFIRFIHSTFYQQAFKYCIVDTDILNPDPLVQNNKRLQERIAQWKQFMAVKLAKLLNSSELIVDASTDIFFDSSFGADGVSYDKLMTLAANRLKDFDWENFDSTDKNNAKTLQIAYLTIALNNFDYLIDSALKDIIQPSPGKLKGDLNRTIYNLASTGDTSLQDLQGVSDNQYSNALNFVTPSITKIISAIPKVDYHLRSKTKFTQGDTTLQIGHILQFGHWLRLMMPEIKEIYPNLSNIDMQYDPIGTVKQILASIYNTIKNYDDPKITDRQRKFIEENNSNMEIQTALSLYEFLFNKEDRINAGTRSIETINNLAKYKSVPKFNIINEIVQQINQVTAPIFIEYPQAFTIASSTGSNTIKDHVIQRFNNSRAEFLFLNPVQQTIYIESFKEKSEIAQAIKNHKGHDNLADELNDPDQSYFQAIKQLLNLQEGNDDNIKSLLIQAEQDLGNHTLYTLFRRFADIIEKSTPGSNIVTYWNTLSTAITDQMKIIQLDYEKISTTLSSLLNSAPASTFMTITGKQIGIYSVISMASMLDHAQARYKIPDKTEKALLQKTANSKEGEYEYREMRQRSNILVASPGLLQKGRNQNYSSNLIIPLSKTNTKGEPEEYRKTTALTQDLTNFLSDFMSLILSSKNPQPTPMWPIQFGSLSDKGRYMKFNINGLAELPGKLTINKLLTDPTLLLKVVQAFQSTKTLDLVNHVADDWITVFKEISDKYSQDPRISTELLTKINEAISGFKSARALLYGYKDQNGVIHAPHSDLFQAYISDPNGDGNFTELMTGINPNKNQTKKTLGNVSQIRQILENNIRLINEALHLMSKDVLQEIVPDIASEKGIKITDKLYYDKYSGGLEVNHMMMHDLAKDCTIQIFDAGRLLQDYYDPEYKGRFIDPEAQIPDLQYYYYDQVIQGLKHVNDPKLRNPTSFFEILKTKFLLSGASTLINQVENQHSDRITVFDGIMANGKFNEYQLAQTYFSYSVLQSFLRHSVLDLTVKEPYLDGKGKSDLDEEISGRWIGTAKRNNTITATIIPFTMNLVNGVSHKTKICVIDDTESTVFNTIGAQVDLTEYDGLGLESPLQVRMEDASLNHKHKVGTKKTFVTPISDYQAEELKWASNEISNKKIRESQNCRVPLLSIFERMHNIPFDPGTDLTRQWQDMKYTGKINISAFLGTKLISREGFKYYQYVSLQKIDGENQYIITKQEVDPKTGRAIGNAFTEPPVTLDSIWAIYKAFNGINCCEFTKGSMKYSENIMEFLYQLVWRVGNKIDKNGEISQTNIHQPLRSKFTGILATLSSNKRGASNIVSSKAWTDPNIKLSTSEIELACGGKQLDAEHHADGSSITKGTQLIQVLAQKGYTYELVSDLYDGLNKLINNSSESFKAFSELVKTKDSTELAKVISEEVLKQLSIQGNNENLQNLLQAFFEESQKLGEPFTLPLSAIIKEVIKSYAPELNKNVIKQQDSGLMGTLNGSSGFIQVYELGGKFYTQGDFMNPKTLQLFKKYEPTISKILDDLIDQEIIDPQNKQIEFDNFVRYLALLHYTGDLEKAQDYFKGLPQSQPLTSDDPFVEKWLYNLLLTSKYPEQRRQFAIDYFNKTGDNNFLGFSRINKYNVKPGDAVIDLTSGAVNIIDSETKILNLSENNQVFLDRMIPSDLKPQSLTISTETGHSENEYTSFESQMGARLTRWSEQDKIIYHLLIQYLNHKYNGQYNILLNHIENDTLTNFDRLQLSTIQEHLINFKNHAKYFGFTFKAQPDFSLFENNSLQVLQVDPLFKDIYHNPFYNYYGELDPLKDFEQQIQKKIIQAEKNKGTLVSDFKKAIAFYAVNKPFNALKTAELNRVIKLSDQEILQWISDHPNFVFNILPFNKRSKYKEYLSQNPQFERIIESKLQKAQIIMPNIYKGKMPVDNLQLTAERVRHAENFYKINEAFFNDKSLVNVDFVVRTFNSTYNIVITDDLTSEAMQQYGEIVLLTSKDIDEDGYRINPKNKQRLYKLPKNTFYQIRKINGIETIVFKQTSTTAEEIKELLNSDNSKVSIQPFLANINKSNKEVFKDIISKIKYFNIIPSFNSLYYNLEKALLSEKFDIQTLNQSLTKKYNDQDLMRDYIKKFSDSMYISFIKSLDMIATRIPTQNMSSTMPMEVVGFTEEDMNDVFVTKWQQWVQGSDYDIDKAFILGYNFDENGKFITWSPLQLLYDKSVFEASLILPLPTGKETKPVVSQNFDPVLKTLLDNYQLIDSLNYDYLSNQEIVKIAQDYNYTFTKEFESDKDSLRLYILGDILNRVKEFGYNIPGKQYQLGIFKSLLEDINRHNLIPVDASGYKNYTTQIMHQILNDPRNSTTVYKSIDVATAAFTDPISTLPNNIIYNIDNNYTVSAMSESAATGKDDVGIAANGGKDLFTLLQYYTKNLQKDPPLTLQELTQAHYYNYVDLTLDYEVPVKDPTTGEITMVKKQWSGVLGPIADTQMSEAVLALYNESLPENKRLYHYNDDAAQNMGALISMAADNAKTLALDKINAKQRFFAMHIFLALNGVPADVITYYFNSPAFVAYFKNDMLISNEDKQKGYVPNFTQDQINVVNFIKNCADEITALAGLLSINQGIKVEESEIVKQHLNLVNAYRNALNRFNITGNYFADSPVVPYPNAKLAEQRRARADMLMKKYKIKEKQPNGKIIERPLTLRDPFNLKLFLTDPAYKECIKSIYDCVKMQYNIFDVIDQVPHFQAMFKSYQVLLEGYCETSALMDFEVNQAVKLFDKEVIYIPQVPIEGTEMTQAAYELPYRYDKNLVAETRKAWEAIVFEEFLKDIVSENAFKYKHSQDGKQMVFECDFQSDDALHDFMNFFNGVIYPKLFEMFPDNYFLKLIQFDSVEASHGANLLLRMPQSLSSLMQNDVSGKTQIQKIRQAFNEIRKVKIADIVGNATTFKLDNLEVTFEDFLYIYELLAQQISFNRAGFGEILIHYDHSMKYKHMKYIKEIDSKKRKIDISPERYMAHIAKRRVNSRRNGAEYERVIEFTDEKIPDITIQTSENKQTTYQRYLIGMPPKKKISKNIINQDLFINAILDKIIKIISIDQNC